MARPKEFDREAVLDRAVDLFWSKGYEATSMGDLVDALGIGRQSIYDTFGDKHALYVAALDRYRERFGGVPIDALHGHGALKKQVRDVLRGIVDKVVASGRSCMLVNAAAERCPTDDAVGQRFCANTLAIEDVFAKRFTEARRDGELGFKHEPRALARYFVTQILGLQIAARGGADAKTLEQSIDLAVAILNP